MPSKILHPLLQRSTPLAIDEQDSNVVKEIHKISGLVESLVKLNDKHRVVALDIRNVWPCSLRLFNAIGELKDLRHLTMFMENPNENRSCDVPVEIGNLTHLETLRLTSITSLPASIGNLKNLRELDLTGLIHLRQPPCEIGNLVRLEKLNLQISYVQSLPSSIGNLKNLRELDLRHTYGLRQLPCEIGNLARLEKLLLSSSGIDNLPVTIENLRNLQELDVSSTRISDDNPRKLPKALWNLRSLRVLHLRCLRMRSIPPVIHNLQHLESLSLDLSLELESLPEEIGNLTNLKTLSMTCTAMTSLPSTIGSLTSLRNLMLDYRKFDKMLLVTLAKRLPFLGSLGCKVVCYSFPQDQNLRKLERQLERNRARFHLQSPIKTEWLHTTPQLWPRAIHEVLGAHEARKHVFKGVLHEFKDGVPPHLDIGRVAKFDAIYWILQQGREAFLLCLVDRPRRRLGIERAHAARKSLASDAAVSAAFESTGLFESAVLSLP